MSCFFGSSLNLSLSMIASGGLFGGKGFLQFMRRPANLSHLD